MNMVPALTKTLSPAAKFISRNEGVLLTVGTIGSSVATTAVTFRNAPKINDILNSSKKMIEEETDAEKRKQIYGLAIKELTPLVIPIVLLQSSTIIFSIRSKIVADRQIADATSALAVANSAIASYQAFQKKAEEELGEKKVQKIREGAAKEMISQNPQSDNNTSRKIISASANDVTKYWDNLGGRYIYSTKSSSAFKGEVMNLFLNLKTGKVNQYDEYGQAKITYNDIISLLGPNLELHPMGDQWGILDSDIVQGDITSSTIDYYLGLGASEDPLDNNKLVWAIMPNLNPLFRSRY